MINEHQQEMDLGPTERLGGFIEERLQFEARQKRLAELGVEACKIIEEVFTEAYKVIDNPEPSLVGETIAEMMKPILEEYRKIMANK